MGLSPRPLEETMKQRSALRPFVLGAAILTAAVVATAATDSPITVTEQRLLDQRIQADVMNALAGNPLLTGRVVVETREQVVSLSGYLATEGQVRRAGREASQVRGVRYVVNEIRPRLGVVTN